jgi:Fe/S biogenesis protein NfuA
MLTFTPRAQDMVRSFMDTSDGELPALRILVTGGSPVAPSFELTLVDPGEEQPSDFHLDGGGFTVLLDPESARRLEGAKVDFVERVNETGFELIPPPLLRKAPPTGPLADQVQAILDTQVNPSIASHGGKILLFDVDGTEISLEMTGGCQGCAMSRMTLRQGVERMIREALPQITAIHDVTDHASGENPFYKD